MLKTHKKVKLPLILTAFGLSLAPLFQSLIYTSDYVYAESGSISTQPTKRTLADIQNMQDMTPEVCANTETPAAFLADGTTINTDVPQKQLIDTRDGKKYWVAKLADGNCWMTQNLDLDLVQGKTYTSVDTDLTETGNTFTPGDGEATIETSKLDSTTWPNTNNIIRSYDPGNKYCNDSNCDATNSNAGMNGHDAQGNLYSWGAATAGQANSLIQTAVGEEAAQSICPKGWRLPSDSRSASSTKGPTFAGLGLTISNILEDPYYFIGGGYVANGSLRGTGSNGYYWSSTADGDPRARLLYFNSSNSTVNPSYYGLRYYGYSIRCVSPSGTTTPDDPNAIYDPNASVTIDPVLTLEVNKTNVNIEPTTNRVNTGEFVATVTSNVGYKLTLSSNTSGLVGQDANNSSFSIPAIGSDQLITPGENGWGIRSCKVPDATDSAVFTDCPQNPTTAETTNKFLSLDPSYIFAESNTGGVQPTTFQVGIGVSSALPSGTYGATVTVTASQK